MVFIRSGKRVKRQFLENPAICWLWSAGWSLCLISPSCLSTFFVSFKANSKIWARILLWSSLSSLEASLQSLPSRRGSKVEVFVLLSGSPSILDHLQCLKTGIYWQTGIRRNPDMKIAGKPHQHAASSESTFSVCPRFLIHPHTLDSNRRSNIQQNLQGHFWII